MEELFGHELFEPGVAQPPRSFLDALGRFAGFRIGSCFLSGVHTRLVKRNFQLCRQFAAEFQIAIGLCAAQPVVQVRGMEHQAQLLASRR